MIKTKIKILTGFTLCILLALSFVYKHAKTHFIYEPSDFITVIGKNSSNNEGYTFFFFGLFGKVSKDKPCFSLILQRKTECFSIKGLGKNKKKQFISEKYEKRELHVSQEDFEKYGIGDVVSIPEAEKMWASATVYYPKTGV